MEFHNEGTHVTLERSEYHFEDPRGQTSKPVSGIPVLGVYYNYDLPNGEWGSVTGSYLLLTDVAEWIKGMESVEKGERNSFEKTFYMVKCHYYFLRLSIEHNDSGWALKLSINDDLCPDEYIDVEQSFSDEEWRAYADEFRSWSQKFKFNLGDEVCIMSDVIEDDYSYHEGIVTEILMPFKKPYPTQENDISYVVSYKRMGYRGLYWDGHCLDSDAIMHV